MRGSQCFAYKGLTVRVQSDDPAHLLWLEEFLTPSFTLMEEAEADRTVVVTVDDRGYDEAFRRGPHSDGHQVDCFMLDSGPVRLPVWVSASVERVIFDERFKVFYLVSRDGAQIGILTASQNQAARIALMRVVREFAMMHSWTGTRLIIHGAAFAVGESGVIIAGPKGAGKTSLLIHSLQDAGARFITNDRVVVDLAGAEPMLHGMPTIVTIRDQTLDLFPELGKRLLQGGYDHRFTLTETIPEETRAVRSQRGRPIDLTPAQFCTLLDVSMREQSPVRALLFPRVTEGDDGLHLRELSAQAAGERLSMALFGARSSQRTSQVFTSASHLPCIDHASLENLCAVLTARIRCFDCWLGRQAYQKGTAGADFIKQALYE